VGEKKIPPQGFFFFGGVSPPPRFENGALKGDLLYYATAIFAPTLCRSCPRPPAMSITLANPRLPLTASRLSMRRKHCPRPRHLERYVDCCNGDKVFLAYNYPANDNSAGKYTLAGQYTVTGGRGGLPGRPVKGRIRRKVRTLSFLVW